MNDQNKLVEILTGRLRPRHRRFHYAFEQLCNKYGQPYQLRPLTKRLRLMMQIVTRYEGIRVVKRDKLGTLGILHQSLNRGSMPYIAEFDMPLAVHGYNVPAHLRSSVEARRLMELPQLRALITFSDWARRSFALHFGPKVGAKCRTVYPLAFEGSYCGNFKKRSYDFSFISINFRTKCGPEVVRAFCNARKKLKHNLRMCVVTRLAKAREQLGNLSDYEGIEWREAKLSEQEIAILLADTCCLVHPSLNDSFGVVVLEALSAGCALIATDIASFPELVLHNINGWLIKPSTSAVVGDTFITEYGNVDYHTKYLNTLSLHQMELDIAKWMITFVRDSKKARLMMKASYQLYEQKYSLAAWNNQIKCVIRESFPELGAFKK